MLKNTFISPIYGCDRVTRHHVEESSQLNDHSTLIEIGAFACCSIVRVGPWMSAAAGVSHVRSLAPALKRSLDLIGALLLLLILFPIMLLLALILRLDGGPALDGQTCVGRNGRPFKRMKFRTTMDGVPATNAQVTAGWDHQGALIRDRRMSRTGAFLHASSLAELPQLLNVVRGDMTLIGPDRRD
jgi:lipopolysaccharide/colanic/teichoic acid biosynthesis glycosyltransferase